VTALELFLQEDHRAEWHRHLTEARRIAASVEGLPGVEVTLEDDQAVWTAPTLLIRIDQASELTAEGVLAATRSRSWPAACWRSWR
jgi:hypothetical protein